jgi:ribosomal protein S18 acetylase RimI-like enzyme
MGASDHDDLEIRRLAGPEEAAWCARIMSESEPWVTLKRTYENALAVVNNPTREVYVASRGGELRGFIVLSMQGAFIGYVQTICIAPGSRRQGLGSRLLAYAEWRILRDSPNVFMCVSSFNTEARRLYERLGYEEVGELAAYLVPEYSEILLRKTIGPWRTFKKQS